MNLAKLFEMQKKLDNHIIEKKGLQGQDLLPNTILALQVELGELANEWRGFKHWSEDREPRTWYPNEKDTCESCKGQPIFTENGKIVGQCENCDGCGVHFHNPLLEEYVDCLHFILSIGNQLNINTEFKIAGSKSNDISKGFAKVFRYVSELWWDYYDNTGDASVKWFHAFHNLLGLGGALGFTWSEIEQAYIEKNKVNHERQEDGY